MHWQFRSPFLLTRKRRFISIASQAVQKKKPSFCFCANAGHAYIASRVWNVPPSEAPQSEAHYFSNLNLKFFDLRPPISSPPSQATKVNLQTLHTIWSPKLDTQYGAHNLDIAVTIQYEAPNSTYNGKLQASRSNCRVVRVHNAKMRNRLN